MIRLDSLPKPPPAEAPGGYFDALPDRVLARVHTGPAPVAKTRRLWPKWAMPAAVAAALGGLMLYINLGQTPPLPAAPTDVLADLGPADMLQYLDKQNLNPGDLPFASEPSALTDSLSNPVRWIQLTREEVQEQLADQPIDEII